MRLRRASGDADGDGETSNAIEIFTPSVHRGPWSAGRGPDQARSYTLSIILEVRNFQPQQFAVQDCRDQRRDFAGLRPRLRSCLATVRYGMDGTARHVEQERGQSGRQRNRGSAAPLEEKQS